MINLDNERNLLTFNSVVNLISSELVPVNDTAKVKIRQARAFFEDMVRGIESLSKKSYVPIEYLKEVLEHAGHSTYGKIIIKQWEEIDTAKDEFKEYIKELEKLETNPKEFYSGVYSHMSKVRLYNICRKMQCLFGRLADEENRREDARTLNRDD